MSYEGPVAARIPRRPEIPGIPGYRLPGQQRAIQDVAAFDLPDDDEPTHPFAEAPTSRTVLRAKSLSVGGLTPDEAGQLAGIIAAWEGADATGRLLLAEFAKRLVR
jgi:hypothetical protein